VGSVPTADDRIERSRLLYERATFTGDAGARTIARQIADAVGGGR
jgi:hypothetical protein